MYQYDGRVFVEDDDQCKTCKNFSTGVACPLLQALGMGLVTLEDSLVVTNCGFYEKLERHLKLLDEEEPENNVQTFGEVKPFKKED